MAPFKGFIGETYGGRSSAADAEKCFNYFPERIESPTGATKTDITLLVKPGLAQFAALAGLSLPSLNPPPGITITSYSMDVLSTFTPNSNTSGSPIAYASTQVPWGGPCGYLSFNNLLPNSNPTPNPIGWTPANAFSTVLTLYIQRDATVTLSPPDQLAVYDVYLNLTYSNGATAKLRPSQWQVVSVNPGFPAGGLNGIDGGTVLNPARAFDNDATTFATIQGPQFTFPASFSPLLQCTNFVMVSSTGSVPMDPSGAISAVRAECELNGRGFAIGSNGPNNYFYEVHADGTVTNYAVTAPTSSTPYLPGDVRPQMEASQTQILILSGGQGFVFDLRSNTLSAITAAGFPAGAVKAGYLDGYFIVLEPNSQTFAISGLNNGLVWDALDFGDAEGEPGNVTTFVVDHRQIWFLSNSHGEIYYNSGDANFPLVRLEGAFMEQGCEAIDSAFKCDNTIFWLGGNRDGAGIVWRANGYTPQRVSTYAIEALIQGFGDVSDCLGYCYQESGHTFARWDFPSANNGLGATLLYDVGEQLWHERGWWDSSIGDYRADLARYHMYVFGLHLVGDYRSGNIYVQSMDLATDAGNPIRRLRSAPDLANGGKWTFYGEFRLLTSVGLGLDGGAVPGSDPQMILQISNDGGKTWGFDRARSLGKIGDYRTLVRWTPNGRSLNRAFRVVCSEPVREVLIAADLDVTS